MKRNDFYLFNCFYNCFEGSGVVHCEVGKYFSIERNTLRVEFPNELRIRHFELSHARVDTLYPQGAESTFFVTTIAISVLLSLFPSILGYGPYVFAG